MNLSTPRVAPALLASLAALLAALLAVLLAGCAASSPAPVLLTLPPAAAPVAATGSAASAPAAAALAPLLAVRRIGIPEYLVARRVRFRADASTLAEWPNTYWAERIEIGVSRELVSALRAQLPGWTLCNTDCGDQLPALTLQIDLVPMDYLRAEKKLQARARIALNGAGAVPKLLQTRELAVDVAAGADSAQAHAQTISTLIQQVAAAAAPMVRTAAP